MQGEASETPEKIVCEKCGAEMHIVRDSYQMGMGVLIAVGAG